MTFLCLQFISLLLQNAAKKKAVSRVHCIFTSAYINDTKNSSHICCKLKRALPNLTLSFKQNSSIACRWPIRRPELRRRKLFWRLEDFFSLPEFGLLILSIQWRFILYHVDTFMCHLNSSNRIHFAIRYCLLFCDLYSYDGANLFKLEFCGKPKRDFPK